jgi:MFS family permease
MSFVADFSPSTHLGRSYGWYTTAIFSAMSIGPAAGGILAHSYGYNPAFIISGSIILLTFTTAVLFFPATPVSDTPFSRRNITRTVRMISSNPVLLAGWIVTLAGCFGRGMFNTFIPLYAQNQGLDARQIGFLFFSEGLVNALIRIPFGYISDKSGNRNLFIIIGMIGLAAAMTGYGFSTDLAVFILLSLLQGISMGVTFTSIGALIAESVAPEYRGVAMGGYNTCIYFGMMLSSAIMGNVILAVGFENAFFLTALVFLLSVAIFFLLTGIGRTVE